ncbi:hypothetical protein Emed_006649 [Eimeria media]
MNRAAVSSRRGLGQLLPTPWRSRCTLSPPSSSSSSSSSSCGSSSAGGLTNYMQFVLGAASTAAPEPARVRLSAAAAEAYRLQQTVWRAAAAAVQSSARSFWSLSSCLRCWVSAIPVPYLAAAPAAARAGRHSCCCCSKSGVGSYPRVALLQQQLQLQRQASRVVLFLCCQQQESLFSQQRQLQQRSSLPFFAAAAARVSPVAAAAAARVSFLQQPQQEQESLSVAAQQQQQQQEESLSLAAAATRGFYYRFHKPIGKGRFSRYQEFFQKPRSLESTQRLLFNYEAPFAAAKASGLRALRLRKRLAAATNPQQLLHVLEAYRSGQLCAPPSPHAAAGVAAVAAALVIAAVAAAAAAGASAITAVAAARAAGGTLLAPLQLGVFAVYRHMRPRTCFMLLLALDRLVALGGCDPTDFRFRTLCRNILKAAKRFQSLLLLLVSSLLPLLVLLLLLLVLLPLLLLLVLLLLLLVLLPLLLLLLLLGDKALSFALRPTLELLLLLLLLLLLQICPLRATAAVDALSRHLKPQVPLLYPQQLAVAAAAFGAVRLQHKCLLESIAAAAMPYISEMHAGDLLKLLRVHPELLAPHLLLLLLLLLQGFAGAQLHHYGLVSAISSEVQRRVHVAAAAPAAAAAGEGSGQWGASEDEWLDEASWQGTAAREQQQQQQQRLGTVPSLEQLVGFREPSKPVPTPCCRCGCCCCCCCAYCCSAVVAAGQAVEGDTAANGLAACSQVQGLVVLAAAKQTGAARAGAGSA